MSLVPRRGKIISACAIAAALCLAAFQQVRAADAWRFVLPEPGAEHEFPPPRAIPLAGEKPDDVKEEAEYRGTSRRYAQLRYGSPSAPRVAIVVDQIAPGEVDLYVDMNRDRTIAADERCTGEGRLWRVPLDVNYARGDEFDVYPRALVFRLGSTGRTLSYAAAGYLEGELPLPPEPQAGAPGRGEGGNLPLPPGEGRGEGGLKRDGVGIDGGLLPPLPPGEGRGEGGLKRDGVGIDGRRQSGAAPPHPNPLPPGEGTDGAPRNAAPEVQGITVRRMDGDANGFFTDPQDRLWIDLNGDGRWNAVEEQFLYSPTLTLAGERYSVRSDERGTRLALARLVGTGTVRLVVHQKPSPASNESGVLGRVAEIAVTLVGRDGSAVGLRGANAEATVPIGEYRVSAVACTLDDAAGGARWNFVFSDNQGGDAKRWHELKKDGRLTIDPLEKIEFAAGQWQAGGACRPGDDLTFQPKLLTIDGLLINTCYRGSHDTGRDGACATIKLTSGDGALLSTAQSGFA